MNLSFYLQQGYKIKSEDATSYTLCKKQSIFLHIILLSFTMGIGNILYYLNQSNKTVTVTK
jgi:hypothetical protein